MIGCYLFFRNEAFIAQVVTIRDVERLRAAIRPSLSASIDPISLDEDVESSGKRSSWRITKKDLFLW